MALIDKATLKLDGLYDPFNGVESTLNIDLDKSLESLLEDYQEEYNPMVGRFILGIQALFSCEGAKVIKKDKRFFVENFESLSKKRSCNLDALNSLKKACEIDAHWYITEGGEGIVCPILKLDASVLKAYNPEFDIEVDTLYCADAVSGDMLESTEQLLKIQEEVYDKIGGSRYIDVDMLGVLGITSIECETGLIDVKLINWLLDNIKGLTTSYVATPVHIAVVNTTQAYYNLEDSDKKKFSRALTSRGYEKYKKTGCRFKWLEE